MPMYSIAITVIICAWVVAAIGMVSKHLVLPTIETPPAKLLNHLHPWAAYGWQHGQCVAVPMGSVLLCPCAVQEFSSWLFDRNFPFKLPTNMHRFCWTTNLKFQYVVGSVGTWAVCCCAHGQVHGMWLARWLLPIHQ